MEFNSGFKGLNMCIEQQQLNAL